MTLVPGDAREVEALRLIFQRYASGSPIKAIVRELEVSKVPPPRGEHWSPISVLDMLRTPAYAGDLAWNKRSEGKYHGVVDGRVVKREGQGRNRNDKADWIVVPDAHEALVSRETWAKVQAILSTRGTAKGGARRAQRFALSGLLRCSTCGGSYGGQPEKNTARYQCRGLDPLRSCRSNTIQAPVIEGAVLRALQEALAPYRSSPRLRQKLLAKLTKGQPVGSDLSGLDRRSEGSRAQDQPRLRQHG